MTIDSDHAAPRIRRPRTRAAIAAAVCTAIAAVAVVTTFGAGGGACRSDDDTPPNVLFIVMDTTRADRCSVNGYGTDTTPNLRALAASGTTYTGAWSVASWTVPAHASLFTGRPPEEHRCGSRGTMVLGREFPTLAEILRANGWATACFSANPFVAAEFGLTRGFDHEERRPRVGRAAHPAADDMLGAAGTWMSEQESTERPCFAFVNLMEAHAPFDPSEASSAKFRRGAADDAAADERGLRKLGPGFLFKVGFGAATIPAAQRERMQDLYDADIADADAAIGRFLARRDAEGARRRTLVIVTSDHGEGLGDHRWIDHSTLLNQEFLRVPLVVRFPGRFDQGRVVTDVVGTLDVFATVLDVCSLPVPAGAHGMPLDRVRAGRIAVATEDAHPDWVPRIREDAPTADTSILERGRRSLSDGRWHLIEESNGTAVLFDLESDPREQRDVLAEFPLEAARLRATAR